MDERARRIEAVEAAAFADLGQAATGLQPLNLNQHVVDGALISVAEGDPHFLLNRVIGLGVKEPATRDTIVTFKRLFKAADIGRYFVHLHPASQPQELKTWLAERMPIPSRWPMACFGMAR